METAKNKNPLRLLVIMEMGLKYPSGFLRAWAFRDHFVKAGWTARFVSHHFTGPLLWHIKPLYRLYTYLNELRLVRLAGSCDVVYMCKVQSPRLIGLLRRRTKARLVLDFGDAVWMPRYENPEFSGLLPMLDAVTTDNELTAAYVRRFNANCTVVPDSPQIELFDEARGKARKNTDGTVTLGWVGSQSTAYNLFLIWEALERLSAKHPDLHLRLVGTGKDMRLIPPFEKVRYSCVEKYTQEEMISEVLKMDIGLFPLQDVEASRVRGVLKASVYMSGEAAVVSSPVGQCADFIKDGENGMLAGSGEEWERKLDQLIMDKQLRQKLAKGGLETVRGKLTLDRAFETLRPVLEGESHV
ncbi:MAG: glycosyltransferase family 4 protein [Elusimicrobiota bacterium]|nr:glycosyltransferase family 4 protein [Elusimicrobiota bacterium]